jgi:surfeit locus 1 family protein
VRALIVLVAALAGALATARLGWWQLDRAAQRTAAFELQSARGTLPPLDAATLARDAAQVDTQVQRRVRLEGRWRAEHTVLLDNRPLQGRVGFLVVTPLQLGAGDAVPVVRGWLPRDPHERTRVTLPPTPAGPVRVEGRVGAGVTRLLEFDAAASGPIRQNLDLAAYARESGLAMRPLLVVQTDAAADGLLREAAAAAPDLSKHHGYALQWFSLSALITGLYVWFQFIRPRRARAR